MNNTPWPGHGWHKFNSLHLSMVGRLRCVPVLLLLLFLFEGAAGQEGDSVILDAAAA